MEIKICVPFDIPKSISAVMRKDCSLPQLMFQEIDSKPTSIHDIIKPLYYVSRMAFLWPYKYERENKIIPLTAKDRITAYAFLLAILVHFIWFIYKKSKTGNKDNYFMMVVIEIIYTLLVHILGAFSIILINSNFGELTKHFFVELDSLSKLKLFCTDRIHFLLRRKLLLQMTAAISFGIVLTILDMSLAISFLPSPLVAAYLSTYVVQYLMVVIFFQIYIKVEILLLYFQCLNETFRNSYLTSPNYVADIASTLTNFKCEQVKLLRLMHGKLCNLIHINNDLHGWQIVILIFTISALVLNSIFPCITEHTQEKYGTTENAMEVVFIIREIAYITFYCVLLILLAGKCSATRKQALNTGLLAHEILLDLPIEDGNRSTEMYKEQLQLLVEQISYRNPHFSAGGIFSVDYTTVSATANLITSNIIVLLQVRQNPTCNFTVNGTLITQ